VARGFLRRSEGTPAALVEAFGQRSEVLLCSRDHREVEPVRVAHVEDVLTSEGAVAAHQHLLEATSEHRHKTRELLRRTLRRGRVPGSVHEPQALLRLGERDHQRVIPEAALVGEVRAFLLVAVDVAHVRVEIDDPECAPLRPVATLPDALLRLVDRLVQSRDRLSIEAAQEVTGRRRIRDATSAEHPPHWLALLQVGDVLDRRAPNEEVVHVSQDVIRLVIWAS
jgi:hypothetical protein